MGMETLGMEADALLAGGEPGPLGKEADELLQSPAPANVPSLAQEADALLGRPQSMGDEADALLGVKPAAPAPAPSGGIFAPAKRAAAALQPLAEMGRRIEERPSSQTEELAHMYVESELGRRLPPRGLRPETPEYAAWQASDGTLKPTADRDSILNRVILSDPQAKQEFGQHVMEIAGRHAPDRDWLGRFGEKFSRGVGDVGQSAVGLSRLFHDVLGDPLGVSAQMKPDIEAANVARAAYRQGDPSVKPDGGMLEWPVEAVQSIPMMAAGAAVDMLVPGAGTLVWAAQYTGETYNDFAADPSLSPAAAMLGSLMVGTAQGITEQLGAAGTGKWAKALLAGPAGRSALARVVGNLIKETGYEATENGLQSLETDIGRAIGQYLSGNAPDKAAGAMLRDAWDQTYQSLGPSFVLVALGAPGAIGQAKYGAAKARVMEKVRADARAQGEKQGLTGDALEAHVKKAEEGEQALLANIGAAFKPATQGANVVEQATKPAAQPPPLPPPDLGEQVPSGDMAAAERGEADVRAREEAEAAAMQPGRTALREPSAEEVAAGQAGAELGAELREAPAPPPAAEVAPPVAQAPEAPPEAAARPPEAPVAPQEAPVPAPSGAAPVEAKGDVSGEVPTAPTGGGANVRFARPEELGGAAGQNRPQRGGPGGEQAGTPEELAEAAARQAAELPPNLQAQRDALPPVREPLAQPTDPAARAAVDLSDRIRQAAGEPQHRPWDTVVRPEAEAFLAQHKTPEAAMDALIAKADAGQGMSDTDVLAWHILAEGPLPAAVAAGDEAAVRRFVEFNRMPYRQTGTATAQALAARRQWARNATPEQRTRTALHQAIFTPPEGMSALDWTQRLLKRWNLKSIDQLLKLAEKDPYFASQLLIYVSTQKGQFWDGWWEYWRNSILSGTSTQVVNVLSTVFNAAWHFGPQGVVEAMINTVTGNRQGMRFGDLGRAWLHVLPGIYMGAQHFVGSLMQEQGTFERATGRQSAGEQERFAEGRGPQIPGLPGRIIRFPQRMLMAADQFMMTVFTHMDVAGKARQIGEARGLQGAELDAFMKEQTQDLMSDTWQESADTAARLAFHEQSKVAHWAVGLRNMRVPREVPIFGGLQPLYPILPFIQAPVAIATSALRMTPLGGIPFFIKYKRLHEARKALRELKANPKATQPQLRQAEQAVRRMQSEISWRMAQQVVAWAGTLILANAIGGQPDDEEPIITGTVMGGKDLRRLAGRTAPPMTFDGKLVGAPGTRIPYGWAEPLGSVIAMTADAVYGLRTGDAGFALKKLLSAPLGQVSEKTFLAGLSDTAQMLESLVQGEPGQARSFLARHFASYVPNIVRQSILKSAETVKETRIWPGRWAADDTGNWWLSWLDAVRDQATGGATGTTAYDPWGRPVDWGKLGPPYTDIPWRVGLQGKYLSTTDMPKGDQVAAAWNRQHPTEKLVAWGMPNPWYEERGVKHYLSKKEYETLCKLAGERARGIVDRQPLATRRPTLRDVKQARDILAAARQWAMGQVKAAHKKAQGGQ